MAMKSLTVLYDSKCGLCVKAKHWTQGQHSYVPVSFLAQGGAEALRRYPGVKQDDQPEELIAISDEGNVYRDDKAWLMILYSLRRYRPLAMRLAKPAFHGLARRAYYWVSSNRYLLSSWLGRSGDGELSRNLADAPDPPRCYPPRYIAPDTQGLEMGEELLLPPEATKWK